MTKTPRSKIIHQKSKHGFSLIEVIVSVAVFSLAITMLMGTFSGFLKNYSGAKKIQRDVENAQYAMNLMVKTIRTSEVSLVSSSVLNTFDYSQASGNCIKYKIDGDMVQSRVSNQGVPATKLSECVWSGTDTVNQMTPNNEIISSDSSITATPSAGVTRGKVTIVLSVQGSTTTAIPIQMSVSLRQ